MAVAAVGVLVLLAMIGYSQGGCGCGVQGVGKQIRMDQRIIGGQYAEPYSWPWQISQNWGTPNGHFCGGSLLRVKDTVEASDIVLTAGHCQVIQPGGTWWVRAGMHWQSYTYDIEQRNVIKSKRHELYQSFTQNDIMLLKLDRPINFTENIRPICLPNAYEPLPFNSKCMVAGWGRTDKDDETKFADILQQLPMPVYNGQYCSSVWGSVFNQSTSFCAGPIDGSAATCTADSGGVLACKGPNGNWIQYGVVSFGAEGVCVWQGFPPVFAHVPNYVNWIKNGILELSSL
jgi:secreted trypsin-like serine protease